ncbi:MAG: LCP family protein [Clostridiales bacterium]|nr:LCP family protein [Clostridiales bacterium]
MGKPLALLDRENHCRCAGPGMVKDVRNMSGHVKSRKNPFLVVLLVVLIGLLAFVVAAGIYIIKLSLTLQQQPDYADGAHEEAEDDVTGLVPIGEKDAEELTGEADPIKEDKDTVDVLLLGVDSRSNNFSGRSDVMLLIRVNTRTGSIKMVSFMRDLLVNVPGHGKNRINTAYMYGGPELALQVVNETFGLRVENYMLFNFYGTTSIIEMMGGVTIDIESNEIDTTNQIIDELNFIFKSDSPRLKKAVPQRLDGVQATAYMRNRKSGTDSARTNRQRTVLMALLRSLGGMELSRLPGLIDKGSNYLRTNIPIVDLPGYATMLMGLSDTQVGQMVVPDPFKNVNYDGMAVVVMEDPEAEISELHAFLLN